MAKSKSSEAERQRLYIARVKEDATKYAANDRELWKRNKRFKKATVLSGSSGSFAVSENNIPVKKKKAQTAEMRPIQLNTPPSGQLKADHPLFDWLINCVVLNHF